MVSKVLWKQVSATVLEDWNQSRTSCCLESFDNNNCVNSKLCMLGLKNILLNFCVTQKPNPSFPQKNIATFWKTDLAEKWTSHPTGNSKSKILLHSKLEQDLKPQKGWEWEYSSLRTHKRSQASSSTNTAHGERDTASRVGGQKPGSRLTRKAPLELGGHAG